jgi:hypothetical protein
MDPGLAALAIVLAFVLGVLAGVWSVFSKLGRD